MEQSLVPIPASRRPLPLRRRADLELTPQQFGAGRYWLVKDPISLSFFHLKEEEHAILMMLDGTATLTTIQRGFERLFPPQRVSLDAIKSFIAELHRNNLIISDAPGQGAKLLERGEKQRRRQRRSSWMSLLAIRFPGVDPRGLLRWIEPTFGRLFSPTAYLAALGLALSALLLSLLKFDVLSARLPGLESILQGDNLIWLLLCLAGVKVVHELGHAMACRRYGGECHEIGLMLLAFMPCLYCDVTDAWRFQSKWRRMAVAAAGIYVEVFIASVCMYLWWFSEPGLFNTLCLNLVIVCSVNTLLVNGNPLLRYDGYYLLADFTETPNLWQRSRGLLRRVLARTVLGTPDTGERRFAGANAGFLLTYAIASMVYRVFVLSAVLWFLYTLLASHGFESLGRLLVLFVVGGLIVPPAMSGVKYLADPLRRRLIQPRRAIVVSLIVLAILCAILFFPFPYSVSAPASVRLEDATPVYVVVPGSVRDSVAAGTPVRSGDVIAELDDPDLRREIQQLEAARDQQAQRVTSLLTRRLIDPEAGDLLPAAQATLDALKARLKQRRRDSAELSIRATATGIVFPPPRPKNTDDPLPSEWNRSPLEKHNRGQYLTYGQQLCLIGDPRRFEAVVIVPVDEIESVQIGRRVRLSLTSRPGAVIAGEVVDISRSRVDDDDRLLNADQALPTDSFTVRVRLPRSASGLIHGESGQAKITAGHRSLASRMLGFVRRTFRSTPSGL